MPIMIMWQLNYSNFSQIFLFYRRVKILKKNMEFWLKYFSFVFTLKSLTKLVI